MNVVLIVNRVGIIYIINCIISIVNLIPLRPTVLIRSNLNSFIVDVRSERNKKGVNPEDVSVKNKKGII